VQWKISQRAVVIVDDGDQALDGKAVVAADERIGVGYHDGLLLKKTRSHVQADDGIRSGKPESAWTQAVENRNG
jgi:hypothetical protein